MIQIGNSQFIIFQLKQYPFQEMIYYRLWSRAEIVLPDGQKNVWKSTRRPGTGGYQKITQYRPVSGIPAGFQTFFLDREYPSETQQRTVFSENFSVSK